MSYYSGKDLAIFHQHPHVAIATNSPVHFLVNSCYKEIGLYVSKSLSTQNVSYIYIYIHTCIHIYIHTETHTFIHTHTYTYTHIHIHTYMHTYIHTYIHTHTYTYIHTYMHACLHAYIRKHTHTHTYIHTQTRLHTYTINIYRNMYKHVSILYIHF